MSEAYSSPVERSPSEMGDDPHSFARTVGTTGVMAAFMGLVILVINERGGNFLPKNVGVAAMVVGIAMAFFHASRDGDITVRRTYGYAGGYGLPICGLILTFVPIAMSYLSTPPEGEPRKILSLFFPYGWACFPAGLMFLIAYLKQETDENSQAMAIRFIGIFGLVLGVGGLAIGHVSPRLFLTYGSMASVLGLGYLAAFVVKMGPDDRGRSTGFFIIFVGLAAFAFALIRGFLPNEARFLMPTGFLSMSIGAIYVCVGAFLVSDAAVVVMTRRELSSYFQTPIGYFVLLGVVLIAGLSYTFFVVGLAGDATYEPIIKRYLGDFYSIVSTMLIVPAITMRLFSEEKRTGTYEVLMVAPVSEPPVVVSKLFAGWVFFMLTWVVWAAYLVVLRLENDKPFEYRPLLSFFMMVGVTGLNFIAMGMFFSSLTKNQIVAAMLTYGGMIFWLSLIFAQRLVGQDTIWRTIFTHTNFVSLWWESLDGRLHLRDAFIQLSFAAFWSYLTVKVLEARRWS
jgi:ABC-2 type transport system permease protein